MENWLFCKTLVEGRLVRFCKCANVRLEKKKLKMRVGKNFKNIRVGFECRLVGLCKIVKGTIQLKSDYLSGCKISFFSRNYQGCTVVLRLPVTSIYVPHYGTYPPIFG